MADKILMNKNFLAALKIELQEYRSALPVFEMKEQQLKEVVTGLENSVKRLEDSIEQTNQEVKPWSGVISDNSLDLDQYVRIANVRTLKREVAGLELDEFVDIEFEANEADPFETPFWVDSAISIIKDQRTSQVILDIEKRKLELLQAELAEARRMKNALKEVFIPETSENIRKIEIYLGDVERLAIGCAKLVKKKKLQYSGAL